jgi:hypothetical protein
VTTELLPQNPGSFKFEPANLVNASTWTLARMRVLGVQVPGGCRLELAGKLVRRVLEGQEAIEPEDSLGVQRLTEAHWTVIEQYTVVRALDQKEDLAKVGIEKLKTMLGGPDIAADETNPIARNTQFELYVGACLAFGGVSLHLKEPDLTFQYQGTPTGIAVKRVRSSVQLAKRAKEAADQIQASGMPGFVAVNVDQIMKLSGASRGVGLDQQVPELAQVEADLCERPGVLGLIGFGHRATWTFAVVPPKLEIGSFNRVRLFSTRRQKKGDGDGFWSRVLTQMERNLRAIW